MHSQSKGEIHIMSPIENFKDNVFVAIYIAGNIILFSLIDVVNLWLAKVRAIYSTESPEPV